MSSTDKAYKKNVAHAEQALQLLQKHAIIPDEKNFALWKAYAEGHSAELINEINYNITLKKPFTQPYCKDLYNRFIKSDHDMDEVSEISHRLEKQLTNLLETLSSAGKINGTHTENLKTARTALNSTSITADGIKSVLDEVISATQEMIKKNARLDTQLKQSTKHVAMLNEDLGILRIQADTDSLTGLANRRYLWKELEHSIKISVSMKKPLCVLVFDIDHFKHFNDTYGHLVGDQVIKFLARTISSEIKKTDTAARFGGDEFTVILPNTSIKSAMSRANKIRKIIGAKKLVNKSTGESLGKITLSIGAAIYREGETSDDLFDRADTALFASKTAGRNRVMLAADVIQY